MLDDDANNRFDDEDDDEDDSDNIAAAADWNGVIQRCDEVLGAGKFWHISASTTDSSRLLAVWFVGKSQYAHRPCLTEPQYR